MKVRGAFIALMVAVGASVLAPLLANEDPLVLHYKGRWYFPFLRFYPAIDFGDPVAVVPDYRTLVKSDTFQSPGNWAVFTPIPYGPDTTDPDSTQQPPSAPSRTHWLGTDDRGRDLLVRLLYGLRHSLGFALLCWAIASVVGYAFGIAQGYLGGAVDLIGQRLTEIWSALPILHVLLWMLCLFAPSVGLLCLVWTAFHWVPIAGIARAETLRIREGEFVQAARAMGVRTSRILARHVFPHALAPLWTLSPFLIATNIAGLAALDFLGLGLPPPMASWGELLRESRENLTAWWLVLFPLLSLFSILGILAAIGDGLRKPPEPPSPPPFLGD